MASIKLQSDILMHLQKELRVNHETALDVACEIIHMMMQSGTVLPELKAAYDAAPSEDEDDNTGLQTLTDMA